MRQALLDAVSQLRRHPAITINNIVEEGGACDVEVNVEVPLPSRARKTGVSLSGVRAVETCLVRFSDRWPLNAPEFLLRTDFPLGLPHINPHREGERVRPCLFEGSLDEMLHRFGLDRVVDQLLDWLRNAAADLLIDPGHGWEPTRRDRASAWVVFSAERAIQLTPNDGTLFSTRARYVAIEGDVIASIDPAFSQVDICFAHSLRPLESTQCGVGDCKVFFARAVDDKRLPFIDTCYQPETVVDIDTLLARGAEIGVDAQTLKNALNEYYMHSVLAIEGDSRTWMHGAFAVVVFLLQRPIRLVGSPNRDIELVSYVVRWWPGENPLVQSQNEVLPALQGFELSPQLLAQTSGLQQLQPSRNIVIAGCGSLGSKIAVHLGRAGLGKMTFVDRERMEPHNSARHALIRQIREIYVRKVDLLQEAFQNLSHENTKIHHGDVVELLLNPEQFKQIIPEQNAIILDTTASLKVLSAEVFSEAIGDGKCRLIRCVMYGQGRSVILALEADNRGVRVDDLFAGLFEACRTNYELRKSVSGSQLDPERIFIGDNCSTLTMPMPDSRVSRGASLVSEQIQSWLATELPSEGVLAWGIEDQSRIGMTWQANSMAPTTVLNVADGGGWQVRILHSVCVQITKESLSYERLETGGVLIGRVDIQTRTIVLAGLVPAPPDSVRTATKFVLGTDGLVMAVTEAHENSVGYLTYVGTWHSHPMGGKHSNIDLSSLNVLAEKANGQPVISLVWTPSEFFCTVKCI